MIAPFLALHPLFLTISSIPLMNRIIFLLGGFILTFNAVCQTGETPPATSDQVRINFINPALELEKAVGQKAVVSTGLGVGYGGGYPDLTKGGSGFIRIISPFLDLQYKRYINLNKRQSRGKSTLNNSANFISLRFLSRGASISENVIRTSNFDFAIGPTWGIQRTMSDRFHFLFDVGPVYYFDTKGNGNIFPLILQINIGYNLNFNR